jgi:hypothetical protein
MRRLIDIEFGPGDAIDGAFDQRAQLLRAEIFAPGLPDRIRLCRT